MTSWRIRWNLMVGTKLLDLGEKGAEVLDSWVLGRSGWGTGLLEMDGAPGAGPVTP
jgi:hypothetical protein